MGFCCVSAASHNVLELQAPDTSNTKSKRCRLLFSDGHGPEVIPRAAGQSAAEVLEDDRPRTEALSNQCPHQLPQRPESARSLAVGAVAVAGKGSILASNRRPSEIRFHRISAGSKFATSSTTRPRPSAGY